MFFLYLYHILSVRFVSLFLSFISECVLFFRVQYSFDSRAIMSSSTSPSEKKWKRPNDVAQFPKVWHRLTLANRETSEKYKVRIQDMMSDQYDEVWDLFTEHFYPDDDVHRLLNMTADEESMVSEKLFYDQTLTQNLSIVAVLDNDDAKPTILGCLLLEIVSKYDPAETPTQSSSGQAHAGLNSVLSWIRRDVNLFEKLETPFILKELGLVVKREYRGMGVGCELFRNMERIAKAFDIPAAAVVLGNSISQKIGGRLGMTLLREGKLIDCVDKNGQKVLLTADPEKTIQWGYFKYDA